MCVCIQLPVCLPVTECESVSWGCTSTVGLNAMTRLRELLCAERSRNQKMTEMISSLKQDKELLQHELAAKAALICDFLQDKLRPGRVWIGSPPTDELSHYNIYLYTVFATVNANSWLIC